MALKLGGTRRDDVLFAVGQFGNTRGESRGSRTELDMLMHPSTSAFRREIEAPGGGRIFGVPNRPRKRPARLGCNDGRDALPFPLAPFVTPLETLSNYRPSGSIEPFPTLIFRAPLPHPFQVGHEFPDPSSWSGHKNVCLDRWPITHAHSVLLPASISSALPRLPAQHDRFFAGVGTAMVHPGLWVHENGGKAVADTPWPDNFDLVSPRVQCVNHLLSKTSLDCQTVRGGPMRPG